MAVGGAVADPNVVAHQLDVGAHPKKVKTVAASGTAQTLDMSAFDAWDITMTGNCTFTITNAPTAGDMSEKVIVLRQDGTGSRLATFPAGMLFSAGSKTLTTAASSVDKITARKDPAVAGQFLCELVKAYA